MNINVRFPESIRDRVKAFADRDRRSMNSEIIQLLEEAMEARERPDKARPAPLAYPQAGERATARLVADPQAEYRADA
ncbi:MAG: Arc family DNA-binding protein [Chloroflexota bacterium]